MNRKLLLGAAFFLAGANLVKAADLPPTYDTDWTGFYATLSAGYSNISLDGSQSALAPGGFETERDKDSSDGAIFGVGAGFNYDMGDFVLGLEGDISLLTNENQLEMKQTVDVDYDWFATGRARAGYDMDGTLIYGTGGIALLRADFDGAGNDDIRDGKQSETFVGWTVGGGIERMMGESWSLRLEALYADFGSENFNLSVNDIGNDVDTKIDADMFLVRAGLSWRF